MYGSFFLLFSSFFHITYIVKTRDASVCPMIENSKDLSTKQLCICVARYIYARLYPCAVVRIDSLDNMSVFQRV